jgi:ABC-2 type transport system ATP-binding protein
VAQRDNLLELTDPAAIECPDDVATRLVEAGHAPTLLSVELEDLEHYFLRLVGMEQSTP